MMKTRRRQRCLRWRVDRVGTTTSAFGPIAAFHRCAAPRHFRV